MVTRSENEKIIDLILTLRAIQIASKVTRFQGLLMLQKILFLAAIDYRKLKYHVLSQSFYRWDWGPMSNEVYDDFNVLSTLGLIQGEKDSELFITPEGEKLLDQTNDIFTNQSNLLKILETKAKEVKDLDSILETVYAQTVFVEDMGREVPMRDIPLGKQIITPVWSLDAKEQLNIDKSWIETFEILINPKMRALVNRSLDEAKHGKLISMELD